MFVPRVGAFFFEPLDDVAQCFEVFETLAATFAIKNDDGRAPEALARNAPIGAMLDHFVHAIFAPGRNPFHTVDLFESFFPKSFRFPFSGCIHFDEPLCGSAKDDGIVATPAMRIAVLVGMMAEKRAVVGEKFDDDGVGREDVLAFVFGKAFGVDAAVVERSGGFEIVFLSGVEVVDAMAGSGVNDAGALVERDVGGENAGDLQRQKGMLKFCALEMVALELGEDARFLDVALGLECSDTISGEKQLPFFGFDDYVFEVWMKGERAVVGNRPGSGGPDDGGNVRAEFCGFTACTTCESEFYPDAWAGVIFVFDFGFGERSGIVNTPINRFAAAIDVALFDEIEKGIGDGGLVFMAHREVGIVPAAEDSEALEIALMLLVAARGKFAAEASKFGGRNFAFATEFFFDLRFDRPTVAIPAGDVRGVMAGHGLGFDDEVFENFVEAGA